MRLLTISDGECGECSIPDWKYFNGHGDMPIAVKDGVEAVEIEDFVWSTCNRGSQFAEIGEEVLLWVVGANQWV